MSGSMLANNVEISAEKLSFLNGVTSDIQQQIGSITSSDAGAKKGLANVFTGTNTFENIITLSGDSAYLVVDDVTITKEELKNIRYIDNNDYSIAALYGNVLTSTQVRAYLEMMNH